MEHFVHAPDLRALLIVPSVCAIEDNYDSFIFEVLKSPHIIGICEIKITLRRNLGLAARYILSGSWHMGLHLLKNCILKIFSSREKGVRSLGKQFIATSDINSKEFIRKIHSLNTNLLVHARTRRIFSRQTLSSVKYGCINIHNGLLPWQKGVKSDLRALSRNEPTGFTLHWMTEKVDSGPIIQKVTISNNRERSYAYYLSRASKKLSEVLVSTLHELQSKGLSATPQEAIDGKRIWSTVPTLYELRHYRSLGLKL